MYLAKEIAFSMIGFNASNKNWIYYTCSKTRLTENEFLITSTLTLKHNTVFELTKWRYFSRKCADTTKTWLALCLAWAYFFTINPA